MYTLYFIGGTVTGLTATQISYTTVGDQSEIEMTWTPLSAAPNGGLNGHQTTITDAGRLVAPTLSISAPPHVRRVAQIGELTVALGTVTDHYPVATVTTTVTVLGERS